MPSGLPAPVTSAIRPSRSSAAAEAAGSSASSGSALGTARRVRRAEVGRLASRRPPFPAGPAERTSGAIPAILPGKAHTRQCDAANGHLQVPSGGHRRWYRTDTLTWPRTSPPPGESKRMSYPQQPGGGWQQDSSWPADPYSQPASGQPVSPSGYGEYGYRQPYTRSEGRRAGQQCITQLARADSKHQ